MIDAPWNDRGGVRRHPGRARAAALSAPRRAQMTTTVVGDVGGDTASALHHYFEASPDVRSPPPPPPAARRSLAAPPRPPPRVSRRRRRPQRAPRAAHVAHPLRARQPPRPPGRRAPARTCAIVRKSRRRRRSGLSGGGRWRAGARGLYQDAFRMELYERAFLHYGSASNWKARAPPCLCPLHSAGRVPTRTILARAAFCSFGSFVHVFLLGRRGATSSTSTRPRTSSRRRLASCASSCMAA